MARDSRGFRYVLEPLRRLTEWRLNDTAVALAQANSAADRQRRRVDDLSSQLSSASAELLALRRPQAPLDIQAQRVAHAYLAQVQHQLRMEAETLRSAQRDREAAFERWQKTQRLANSLDDDREAAVARHDAELAKQAYRQADELWLQRLHWRKNHDPN